MSTNKSNDEGNGFNGKDAFEVNKGFVMTLRTRTGNFGVNTLFYSDCGLDSSLAGLTDAYSIVFMNMSLNIFPLPYLAVTSLLASSTLLVQ